MDYRFGLSSLDVSHVLPSTSPKVACFVPIATFLRFVFPFFLPLANRENVKENAGSNIKPQCRQRTDCWERGRRRASDRRAAARYHQDACSDFPPCVLLQKHLCTLNIAQNLMALSFAGGMFVSALKLCNKFGPLNLRGGIVERAHGHSGTNGSQRRGIFPV